MLDAMLTQIADRFTADMPPGPAKFTGKELVAVFKQGIGSGFAFGVNRRAGEPKPFSIGIVLRKGAAGEARAPIARMIDALNRPGTQAMPVTKAGDRKVIVVGNGPQPGFAWWSEGEDLVLNFMPQAGPDAMINVLDGHAPNATEAAVRRDLIKTVDGFEPVFLAYFDMAALPTLPPRRHPWASIGSSGSITAGASRMRRS